MAQEIPETPEGCKAYHFAKSAHGDQLYGGLPYVDSHVAAVVRVMRDFNFSGHWIDAAWLHDVVEDTSIPIEDIAITFGQDVASLVFACTGVGHNRKARNEIIYRRINRYPLAAFVKTADRIANVEASATGSSHRSMYVKERHAFHQYVASRSGQSMRDRLSAAYDAP